MLLAPVVRRQKGEFRDVIERLAREGFVRARVDGEFVELAADTRVKLDKKKFHNIEVVVDRLVIDEQNPRAARRFGRNRVALGRRRDVRAASNARESRESRVEGTKSRPALDSRPSTLDSAEWIETLHSNKMCSPATGKSYDPPTPKHFSFNAPAGACPVCHGLGQKMIFDESLVVPDPEKSLEDGAVQPWRRAGKRMNIYYKAMLRSIAAHFNVSLETPWKNLPDDFKKVLLHGSGENPVDFNFWRAGKMSTISRPFEGVLPNLERMFTESESEFVRNRIKPYMSPQFCDVCKGKRLKPEILAVTLGGTGLRPLFRASRPKPSGTGDSSTFIRYADCVNRRNPAGRRI